MSGEAQSATVATAVPNAIRVLALLDGAPAAGVVVSFTPTAGSGAVLPTVDTTGVDGIASTQWTLGNVAGTATVNASATGAGGSPQAFHATALPGAPATIITDDGDGQAQEVGSSFARQLQARVKDGFGNGVPGITVSWSVDSGSGSVVQPTSITDANGRAVASITAGDTIGALTIRATITQLPADTAFFGLAVVAAPTIVAIGNNFFNPNALIISPGTSVKWVWNAGTHTVSQLDGPEISMSSPAQSAGATFGPILFTTLGVYHYECTIHSNMLGSISVE